jgi:formylglycine-generating enzyme required for sulfatase activity
VISNHALVGAGGIGGLNWTLPTNLPAGEDYQVRVTSLRNSAITDTSDGSFCVIEEPEFSMTLTAPNAPNISCVSGQKLPITWMYIGIPHSAVRIDLTQNGSVVRNVALNCSVGVGGLGKYDWLVPLHITPGSNYKIRITLASRPGFSDVSDAPFQINVATPFNRGDMIYIPAGSFLMGNSGVGNDATYCYSSELPQHSVTLSGYYIGKHEVTRGEYRAFMTATGRAEPYYWNSVQDWETGSFTQADNYPVVGVTWYDAEAFCTWAGGHLPTEAQWEKAARWTGSYPYVYPWGNTWDAEKCNNYDDHNSAGGGYQRNQTSPVGSYPSGVSPYGCQDVAGNVWEWCQDWSRSYPGSTSPFDYTDTYRVLRGGGWGGYDDNYSRCAYRSYGNPIDYGSNVGFRMAR